MARGGRRNEDLRRGPAASSLEVRSLLQPHGTESMERGRTSHVRQRSDQPCPMGKSLASSHFYFSLFPLLPFPLSRKGFMKGLTLDCG